MKYFYLTLTVLFLMVQNPISIKSQNTYDQIYHMLRTNCANSGCHDGTAGSQTSLNINLSSDSLYNQIINEAPVNPAALNNFNKIVAPGDVQRSFLLRKIAHGISDGLALTQPEGLAMPNGSTQLKNYEIELVRQWIMAGAPKTGKVVDTSVINTYYRTGGVDGTHSAHSAPATGSGFQLYIGRLFLNKNTADTEIYYKIDPHLISAIESPRVSFMMPDGLHHFQLLLFRDTSSFNLYHWGVRPIGESSMENTLYGVGAGPGYTSLDLPPNTAFYLQKDQRFDVDMHIQNPSPDSIYSVDMYVNVYTEPANTTTNYMYNINFPNFYFQIPADGQPHTFTQLGYDSAQTHYWKIWRLYSHTHKYGTAFNIWLRNPDGSKGAEVYNGNYNYEVGYDAGYYRNGTHSTVRQFANDSLLEVNPLTGLIGEATWRNTGSIPMAWGLTTDQEMMVFGFFHIDGDPLVPNSIPSTPLDNRANKVFPNPVADQFVLSYELEDPGRVEIDLLDMVGNKVATLINSTFSDKGRYTHGFTASEFKLQAGIYLVNFNVDGKTATQKLIITD
jgi:hypothetical protein